MTIDSTTIDKDTLRALARALGLDLDGLTRRAPLGS